jgi:hypothetical protein
MPLPLERSLMDDANTKIKSDEEEGVGGVGEGEGGGLLNLCTNFVVDVKVV